MSSEQTGCLSWCFFSVFPVNYRKATILVCFTMLSLTLNSAVCCGVVCGFIDTMSGGAKGREEGEIRIHKHVEGVEQPTRIGM